LTRQADGLVSTQYGSAQDVVAARGAAAAVAVVVAAAAAAVVVVAAAAAVVAVAAAAAAAAAAAVAVDVVAALDAVVPHVLGLAHVGLEPRGLCGLVQVVVFAALFPASRALLFLEFLSLSLCS
jgi:hypothetical protein